MALSPSNRFQAARLWLSGVLRSSHALIGVLAALCVGLFALGRADYPVVAYGSFGLIAIIVLCVVLRYAVKGPEVDRGQPALMYSPQQIQIWNVDQQSMAELFKQAVADRKPLPPPAGLITGSSGDLASVKMLAPHEAEDLRKQDMGQPGSSQPYKPSGQLEPPSDHAP